MVNIGISVLGKKDKIKIINDAIEQGVTHVHYDIIDGIYADNISLFNNAELDEIFNNTHKHIRDVHLMIKNPINFIRNMKTLPDTCSIHFSEVNLEELEEIKHNKKIKWGLAINPNIELEDIKSILPLFSYILIMGVYAGFGGQTYIEEITKKIKSFNDYIKTNNLNMYIQVDGGIKEHNASNIVDAGASSLVIGSCFFDDGISTYKKLQNLK